MFHMLSCFNLQDGVTAEDLDQALAAFCAHMQEVKLVEAVSPIGKRDTNTEMDTDDERNHQFFYTMSFTDKDQCERAYDYIDNPPEIALKTHTAVVSKIKDNIHICWDDIAPA